MTTSNPGASERVGGVPPAAPTAAQTPAGLPDEATLARLANAFFKTLPGETPVLEGASHPQAGARTPEAAAPPPAASPAFLSEAELRAIPAALAGVVGLSAGSLPESWPSAWSPFSFSDVPAPGSLGTAPSVPSPSAAGHAPSSLPPAVSFDFLPVVAPAGAGAPAIFDPAAVKRDFPILRETVHGKPLIWLDNAATTQKPQAVIDRLAYFYAHENSNVHRAAHALAARATDAYEAAREKVRRFLGAGSTKEIVFVRGATEGINLIAQSWGRRHVGAGDEIVVTWLEHHANIVPWQQLAAEKGARLRVAPVDDRGQIRLDEFEKLLNPRTRIVSITHVSNALGTITPVREMVEIAHRHGACVVVDGAQAVSHMKVDVKALGCDYYVFSGHKVFGPTGIGAVYGRTEALERTPPWQGGGNMIADVTFEKTLYQAAPARFEAGTGNIADAVGLGAALDYLENLGLENVARHEHALLERGTERLIRIPGLRLIGTAAEKAGVLSFVLNGFRNEDVGAALDREGIAVRSGHHCAQPILRRFGVEGSVRASFAPYNTADDVDALASTVERLAAGGKTS